MLCDSIEELAQRFLAPVREAAEAAALCQVPQSV